MRRGRKFPSDLRSPLTFYIGVAPAAYRLDAFRINYRKGGLIGTYVYLSFQKPFRERSSSGTSHSRSRGTFHDRNGKMTATKILRSAGDAARLCARYHLPSSLDGAECHHDQQKQLTRRRQQQADDAPSSLTTPNFSVRRRMMSSRHRKQPLPWHCQRHSLLHTGTLLVLPMRNPKRAARSSNPQVFSRKCAPASSLSSASCSLGVTSTPFFPLYSTMAILVITYVILFLPYTAEYLISA